LQAQTIRALVEAGFTPETVVKATDAEDWRLLEHTGMFSVQLWPPGVTSQDAANPDSSDTGIQKVGKPTKPDAGSKPGADANTPGKQPAAKAAVKPAK